jgi:hypothetical protein
MPLFRGRPLYHQTQAGDQKQFMEISNTGIGLSIADLTVV